MSLLTSSAEKFWQRRRQNAKSRKDTKFGSYYRMNARYEPSWHFVDAKNMVPGRIATTIAELLVRKTQARIIIEEPVARFSSGCELIENTIHWTEKE